MFPVFDSFYPSQKIIDDFSLLFRLPCGCNLIYRFPDKSSLINCLTSYPVIVNINQDPRLLSSHESVPAWIEVRHSRNISLSFWFIMTVLWMLVCCSVGFIAESYFVQLTLFFSAVIFIYMHLRNTVTEESLLLISGYGLQTSSRYFTGRRSYSSFIPVERIKGFHLIDSVSPFTICTYLSCEFSKVTSSTTTADPQKTESLFNKATTTLQTDYDLLPLMPITMDNKQIRFKGCDRIPLPYLVWMLRLANTVLFH
ncbi:unnamed protein product [Schistosoma rodhaini]|nr:unnamed protein product [Schistosoma rodhaini]